MIRKLLFTCAAFATSWSAMAQPEGAKNMKPAMGGAKLVEKVVKKGNEIVIPYEKYVLPNGLTVMVHEDHCDPVVHVDVTYHVGSAREEIGQKWLCAFLRTHDVPGFG